MIPSLMGRLQTRIFLYLFVGWPVTFIFAWWNTGDLWGDNVSVFFLILTTILILGLILDPIYIWIQHFRWERDWPFAFQFFFSWIEFGIVVFLIRAQYLPWFSDNLFQDSGEIWTAVYHFSWVFFPSFLLLLGGMQLFFIRWRFKAAEFGRM